MSAEPALSLRVRARLGKVPGDEVAIRLDADLRKNYR
jgi:hypothetical protein